MNMKKNIFLGFMLAGGMMLLTGCESNDPMSDEQYEKVIYVVGASQNVITRELKYSDTAQEAFASVAISGTHMISHDVSVNLKAQNSVIDWYNKKYKYLDADIRYRAMPEGHYSLASYSTAIKANEVYARLPISIVTEGLHCDSLYALTFAIESVSDYAYNQTDSALIMTFKFVNDYSGTYLFSGARNTLNDLGETTATTLMSYNRTFTATGSNAVRFYNEQQAETVANIKDHCLVFNLTGNQVTLSAWEDLDLIDATCTYDSAKETFTADYTYKLNGQLYQFVGTFAKQNSSKTNK